MFEATAGDSRELVAGAIGELQGIAIALDLALLCLACFRRSNACRSAQIRGLGVSMTLLLASYVSSGSYSNV